MSEDTQSSNVCAAALQIPYNEAKWIVAEIIGQGCEEEIIWWIRHVVKNFHEAKECCNDLPYWDVMSLVDYCFLSDVHHSNFVVKVLETLESMSSMLDVSVGRVMQHSQTPPLDQLNEHEQKGQQTFGYLSHMLHHALQKKEMYRGQWFSDRTYKNEMALLPVFAAVKHGSKATLLTLLQYGFPVISRKIWDADCTFLKDLRTDIPAYRDPLQNDKSASTLPEDTTVVYSILNMFMKMYEYDAIRKGDRQDIPGFCEKFCIVWRAIPYPFVTLNRLSQTIYTVHDCLECFWKLIKTRILRKSLGQLQPRSLKHLCRCSVRKRLHQNWKLPYGIEDLKLPPQICKYLNLETD